MLKEPHVTPMTMAGRTMTGFVRVAPEGYRTAAALRKWVKRGLDHVETLAAQADETQPDAGQTIAVSPAIPLCARQARR